MKDLNDLNKLYSESDTALNSHFAEIRSNILLDIGYHHPRRDRFSNARGPYFRYQKGKSNIRITKNHIQNITKYIRNSIQNRAPGGAILPQNEKELSDQKSAELNLSVYECLKEKDDLDDYYSKLIHDFVVCGETYAKVFYDEKGGKFLGYESELDEKGAPVGEPVPQWEGGIVYEKLAPYNVLTDPEADSKREVKWLCYRKLIPRKILEKKYEGDETKLLAIAGGAEDDYQWFDGVTGIYSDIQDGVQVREFYWKPSQEFPNGYFYFATNSGILEEGELPDGFCIFSALYDESPANPRAYSVVKYCKSFQSEINRCAAAIIKESIVLGHSTVMYSAGSKLTTASIGNGLKGLQYTGALPTIIPGRDGAQYEEYMTRITEEMYRIAQVPRAGESKEQQGNDAYAMLFRTMRDKMAFSIYGEKIEKLIIDIIDHSLKLARRYYPDDKIIPIVGKREQVNIAEFRDSSPDQYKIKVVPRTDDFAQMMGKSLQISQVLQYLGSNLTPEMGAELVRQMPFLNDEPVLGDMLVKKDQADAVILSLDRGEQPFFFETAEHEYMLTRLTRRMNEADFPLLPKQTQLNFQTQIDKHAKSMSAQQQEAARAASGFIPSGGGLISADFYVTAGESGKQHRVRLPYESVDWLVKKLNEQGSSVDKIGELPLSAQASVGGQQGQVSNEMMVQPKTQGQQAPAEQGNVSNISQQSPMTGNS